jgi:metal-sulfur cluster biosynthetic enzyme/Fe-S cluster assembly iron-binding protein IscA
MLASKGPVVVCVELTQSAADEIRQVVQQQDLGEQGAWLRVSVDGYGTRRSFALDLTDHREPAEVEVESRGVHVLFSPEHQPRLNGVTIDFLEVGGQRGFVFNTPSVQKSSMPGQGDASAALPDEDQVREVLHEVIDPEVGVNIVDLGLVYGIALADGLVRVRMTMTTPACPLSEHITNEITTFTTQAYPAVRSVEVEIVWDPPWKPSMISDEARKVLGWSR